MTYHNVEQRSEEWFRLRSGKVTASMYWAVEDFCQPTTKKDKEAGLKGREGAERRKYRGRLVAQTLTGYLNQHKTDDERWKGWDVQWGEEFEDIARAEYELLIPSQSVRKVGIYVHDRITRFAASPDAVVGTDGLLQIKCPATTTHIEYIQNGVVPEEYEPQLMAEMACTGRQWSDFVSFDPRLPKNLQLFIVRLGRDEKRIAQVETEVLGFLAEVDFVVNKLMGKEPTLEEKLRASLVWAEGRKDAGTVLSNGQEIPF